MSERRMTEAQSYPEHDKMAALDQHAKQAITDFLEWLVYDGSRHDVAENVSGSKRFCLGKMFDRGDVDPSADIEQALAAYYNIDLKKIEDEKRAMLTAIRAQNTRYDVLRKHTERTG